MNIQNIHFRHALTNINIQNIGMARVNTEPCTGGKIIECTSIIRQDTTRKISAES